MDLEGQNLNDAINCYILDHLEKNGFVRTRAAFVLERDENRDEEFLHKTPIKNLPNDEGKEANYELEQLLSHFDNAYEDAFFDVWDNPKGGLSMEDEPTSMTKRLARMNLRLRVYFNCRKVSEGFLSEGECLQRVRNYFDGEGRHLTSSELLSPSGEKDGQIDDPLPSVITYFALPFVADPVNHQTFKHLFQPAYWSDLRKEVKSFAARNRIKRSMSSSALASVIMSHHNSGTDMGTLSVSMTDIVMSKNREMDRQKEAHAALASKYNQLREDHHKLIAVTKEMRLALEMAAKQQAVSGPNDEIASVDWTSVMLNCTSAYPELFTPIRRQNDGQRPKSSPHVFRNGNPVNILTECSIDNREKLLSESNLDEMKDADNQEAEIDEDEYEGVSVTEAKSSALVPNSRTLQMTSNLNFEKVKLDLTTSRKGVLLLQALRWLLTKAANGHRKTVLRSYMSNDVLGLRHFYTDNLQTIGSDRPMVIACLSSSSTSSRSSNEKRSKMIGSDNNSNCDNTKRAKDPLHIQETLARLINAMASVKIGRDYICEFGSFVEILIECLLQQKSNRHFNSFTVQMIVAILQKLSLKCYIRKKMIEMGIVEWLVNYLDNFDEGNWQVPYTPYGLEYSTALFMNLCLHKSGKQKCFPMAKLVLEMLTQLLSSSSKQIFPYVNGTLYSLLSFSPIMTEAKVMGLEEKLRAVSGDLDDGGPASAETKRQIDYLIGQFGKEDLDDDHEDDGYQEEDDEDEMEEEVEIEEEIDQDDPVAAVEGELGGMNLLESQYSTPMLEAIIKEDEGVDTASSSDDNANTSPVKELEMDIEGSRLSSTNRVAQPPASNKEADPPIENFDDKGATKLTNTDTPTTSTVVPPPQAFEIRNSPPVPTINGGEQDKKMQRKIQLLEQRRKQYMSPRKQLSISETERCEIKLENDLISVTRTLQNGSKSCGGGGQMKQPTTRRRGSDGAVDETNAVIKSRKSSQKKKSDVMCETGKLKNNLDDSKMIKPRKLVRKQSYSRIEDIPKSPLKTKASPGKRKKSNVGGAMTSLLPPPDYVPPNNMVWLKNDPTQMKLASKSINQTSLSNNPNPVEDQSSGFVCNNASPSLQRSFSPRRRSYTVLEGRETSLLAMVQASKPLLPPLTSAKPTSIFGSSEDDGSVAFVSPRSASAALSRARSFTIDPRDVAMTPPSPRKRWNKLSPLKSSYKSEAGGHSEVNHIRKVPYSSSSHLLEIPSAATWQ